MSASSNSRNTKPLRPSRARSGLSPELDMWRDHRRGAAPAAQADSAPERQIVVQRPSRMPQVLAFVVTFISVSLCIAALSSGRVPFVGQSFIAGLAGAVVVMMGIGPRRRARPLAVTQRPALVLMRPSEELDSVLRKRVGSGVWWVPLAFGLITLAAPAALYLSHRSPTQSEEQAEAASSAEVTEMRQLDSGAELREAENIDPTTPRQSWSQEAAPRLAKPSGVTAAPKADPTLSQP